MLVEPVLELKECLPKLLDSVEGPHPQQLLLQGSDEPLSHAVALRGFDEDGASTRCRGRLSPVGSHGS